MNQLVEAVSLRTKKEKNRENRYEKTIIVAVSLLVLKTTEFVNKKTYNTDRATTNLKILLIVNIGNIQNSEIKIIQLLNMNVLNFIDNFYFRQTVYNPILILINQI